MKNDTLVQDWINHQYEQIESDSFELHWTEKQIFTWLAEGQIDEIWQFILSTLKQDDSELVFAALTAGPLEDLLSQYGEKTLEKIECSIEQTPLLKTLIKDVWKNHISDDIWDKLQTFSN